MPKTSPNRRSLRSARTWVASSLLSAALLCASPIAIAQDLLRVLVVSANHSAQSRVTLAARQNAEKPIEFDHRRLGDDDTDPLAVIADGYDVVLLSAVSRELVGSAYARFLPLTADVSARIVAVPLNPEAPVSSGLSDPQASAISSYFHNGGPENFERLGDYLLAIARAGDVAAVMPPIEYPAQGIYHPDHPRRIVATLDAYLSWRGLETTPADQPVVGLAMPLSLFGSGRNEAVDALIRALESEGALALPFYTDDRAPDYAPLLTRNGKMVAHSIINLKTIHSAATYRDQFATLGVPVLQALQYYSGDADAWRADPGGVEQMMTPFFMAIPETAGVIDFTTIAATAPRSETLELIDEQLAALARRATRQARLAITPNAEKRLAMLVWNSPSGDKNVGASFLNVPRSIESISSSLASAGYSVVATDEDDLLPRVQRILRPAYSRDELAALLADDLAALMPLSDYQTHLDTLPAGVRDAMNDDWGPATDSRMLIEHNGKPHFVIPRVALGNLIVMRQPPRSDEPDREQALYHDDSVSVNHFYLAAYLYARNSFDSDALIHLGTHGSQEYLPGKERTLSVHDAAMLVVGDTPVVYPFIVDDVGEAVQAKRRGRAVIVSHLTPPFAAAGLYAESRDLHELMHQYNSLTEGPVRQQTLNSIVAACFDAAYCNDIGWQEPQIAESPDEFLKALHNYLGELAVESQPLGLHTFGRTPDDPLLLTTVSQMLGADFRDAAIDFEAWQFGELSARDHRDSHTDVVAGEEHSHDGHETPHRHTSRAHDHGTSTHTHGTQAHSHDASTHDRGDATHSHEVVEPGHRHTATAGTGAGPGKADQLAVAPGYRTLEAYLLGEADVDAVDDEAMQGYLRDARERYGNLRDLHEHQGLLTALDGRYLEMSTGGDPLRNPAAVPTGYNLYGFDPARVPTRAAWEAGIELTENLIADYYAENGRYPDKMAFSMWSVETMRHYGVLEAQVLRAMGVRPVWTDDGRVEGTELIPMSELRRPRVDVVVSATGLYRDAFSNVMEWMAEAIAEVASLDEADNAIFRNAVVLRQQLEAQGIDADQAAYLSAVRIFSNKSGEYGSGLGDTAIASDTWEADDKLAELYLDRMGYYFGPRRGYDQSHWSGRVQAADLYGMSLTGTDLAVFSRTSNLYGLLSTDDPFQYLGGISLAVRSLDGASPGLYISNLREVGNSRTESIQRFMSRELRNRSFHPRWIESMQVEGYSGALTMLSRLNNFWGWQVTAPESVRADQWQEFFEVYIADKYEMNLDEWFTEVADQAKAQMLERLLEAVRKEYWEADSETLQTMLSEFARQAALSGYETANERLMEYVEDQAVGFGIDLDSIRAAASTNANPGAKTATVEGIRLNEAIVPEAIPVEFDRQVIVAILACLLAFAFGVGRRFVVSAPLLRPGT